MAAALAALGAILGAFDLFLIQNRISPAARRTPDPAAPRRLSAVKLAFGLNPAPGGPH
jgi:hypothetical protein